MRLLETWLNQMSPAERILDLGCGAGSLKAQTAGLHVIGVDVDPKELARNRDLPAVCAESHSLPFAGRSFDLVISHHSLEHFLELEATVREAGRILKPDGALYIAVPDSTTLTDRIYRWLGRGGGHVNPFRAPEEVVALVTRLTGFQHRSTTVLFSALSFLNSHNFVSPPPRRIALFAFGNERFLAVWIWLLRLLDRRFGTRLSQYGWSFWFGNVPATGPAEVWVNVCVRCGSGHSEAYLRKNVPIGKLAGIFQTYRCPACGGFNLLSAAFTPPPR